MLIKWIWRIETLSDVFLVLVMWYILFKWLDSLFNKMYFLLFLKSYILSKIWQKQKKTEKYPNSCQMNRKCLGTIFSCGWINVLWQQDGVCVVIVKGHVSSTVWLIDLTEDDEDEDWDPTEETWAVSNKYKYFSYNLKFPGF